MNTRAAKEVLLLRKLSLEEVVTIHRPNTWCGVPKAERTKVTGTATRYLQKQERSIRDWSRQFESIASPRDAATNHSCAARETVRRFNGLSRRSAVVFHECGHVLCLSGSQSRIVVRVLSDFLDILHVRKDSRVVHNEDSAGQALIKRSTRNQHAVGFTKHT